jgi:hypothetical protein
VTAEVYCKEKDPNMLKSLLVVLAAIVLVQVINAQGVRYVRGDVVRLVAQDNGDRLPDSRIIAIARDRVHVDRFSITVNGVAVQGVSAELLQGVSEVWDQLVPEGHYFVVGESGTPNDMVYYWGLIPAAKIIRKL